MKTFTYDKIVRGEILKDELEAAGFIVETVYSKYNHSDPALSEPHCVVVLNDAELKDPTAIVESHTPKSDPPPRDLAAEVDNLQARVEGLEGK